MELSESFKEGNINFTNFQNIDYFNNGFELIIQKLHAESKSIEKYRISYKIIK